MMKSYGEISNRYMKQNKKRTALTILGIVLATVLIFAVGTFLLSFRDSMISEIRSQGDYEFRITGLNSKEVEKVVNNIEVKDSTIFKYSGEFNIRDKEKGAELYLGDKDYFEKVFKKEIIEGRKPEAKNEIILDYNRKNTLKVNVGDELTFIDKNGKEEINKVVGISEPTGYSNANYLDMYGYFDSSTLDSEESYIVTLNLKSSKDKQEIIKKVLDEAKINFTEERTDLSLENNSELMYLTGNGGNSSINTSLNGLAIFVVIIIIVSTITVIYNSFNISVIERMRYFGVLKAIGATPKQIKRIIFKEGFLMGIIALPIGCVIGYLALKFGIKIFIGDTLLFFGNFEVGFYPSIILVTTILVAITIYLSVLWPARKARKVSAVDAIRNKNEIKIGKLKRRKGKIISKMFGIEGSIAYKNIRRTPFRFIVTVLALTLSIVLFNVFYGFIDFTKQTVEQMFMYVPFDAELQKQTYSDVFTQEEIEEIEKQSFAKEIHKINANYYNIAIPSDAISDENKDSLSKDGINDLNFQAFYGINAYVGGDSQFDFAEKHVVEGKIDLEALRKGGVVLVDGKKIREENGDVKILRTTNYKVGDKIKIPKLKRYDTRNGYDESNTDKMMEAINKGEFYELPIVAILEKNPLMGIYSDYELELMVHEDVYKKYVGDIEPNYIYFTFNENSEDRENAIEYFNDKPFTYEDIGDELKEIDDMYTQVEFFVYCFIAIVTVISIVNIFNTISTNLLLRKKEFSTLKAIGMTEKQLKKNVMLEGTLYGILSAIIGGTISALLLGGLVKISVGLADVKYSFDFIAFGISIVCAILVTYISTIIPLRKIKKLTIVEGISDNE